MYGNLSGLSPEDAPRRGVKSNRRNPGKLDLGPGAAPRAETSDEPTRIVIIDRRTLYRECLASALIAKRKSWVAVTASTVAEWRKSAPAHDPDPAIALFCVGSNGTADVEEQFALLCETGHVPLVALLSEAEDLERAVVTFGQKMHGYIPSNATLEVVVQALELIKLGGVFVSASCISLLLRPAPVEHAGLNPGGGTLTEREHAVLAALRQGRSNKCIAYDLDMSESTVKVHVRNIMKKLKAHNRTEVAFLTRSMFGVQQTRSTFGVQQTQSTFGVQQTQNTFGVHQNGRARQTSDHGQTAEGGEQTGR